MLNPLSKVTILDFSYRAWGKSLIRRDTIARYLNHIATNMKKQKQYYLKHKILSYSTCTTSRNFDKS